MISNQSIRHFMNSLRERHQQLIASLDAMIAAVVGEDVNKKQATANQVVLALDNLRAIVSQSDRPSWLDGFRNIVQAYASNVKQREAGANLINHYARLSAEIRGYKWELADDGEKRGIDFDEIAARSQMIVCRAH